MGFLLQDLGDKTGCGETRRSASRNGFVSGVNCRRAKPDGGAPQSGAKRPAGTREALPGTFCEPEGSQDLHWRANPTLQKSFSEELTRVKTRAAKSAPENAYDHFFRG